MAHLFISWNSGNSINTISQTVEYKKDSSSTWIVAATVPGYTDNYIISNIDNNTLYNVRIGAQCSSGGNAYSTVVEDINLSCPVVGITTGTTNIDYSFNKLDGDITSYKIQLLSSLDVVLSEQTKTVTPVISGSFTSLTINTIYKIRVITNIGTDYINTCPSITTNTTNSAKWIPAAQECESTTLFYNAQVSQFYTTECPEDSTGNSVEYIVPYAKYNSSVSQEAADELAQADLLENGQEYANLNGVCDPNEEDDFGILKMSNTTGTIFALTFISSGDRLYNVTNRLIDTPTPSYGDHLLSANAVLNNIGQVNKGYDVYPIPPTLAETDVYTAIFFQNVNGTAPDIPPDPNGRKIGWQNELYYKKMFDEYPLINEIRFEMSYIKTGGPAYTRIMKPKIRVFSRLAAMSEQVVIRNAGGTANVINVEDITFDQLITLKGKIVKVNSTTFDIYYKVTKI